MISPSLVDEYELKVGPVAFTIAQIRPEDEERVEAMMREVMDGERAPLTDTDLGIHIPDNAES